MTTTSIRPSEIATLLDRAPPGIRILSLDCFDTLLWRATHMPQDVFAGFAYPGGGIEPRVRAEGEARRLRLREDDGGEVTIEQIHAQLPGDPAAGVAAELALEARHCFAFAPVVALIDAAKARGLQVIVVSDTYLGEAQLRDLIAAAAGDDVAAKIDRLFCSSTYGRCKAGGLFADVLRTLAVPPATILHVGDNAVADGDAAAAAGLHAVPIVQFDDATAKRLRLEAAAAVMLDPGTRITLPALQPHRAALALREAGAPAWCLGHDVFGPLLDAFARWIADEAAALAAATGRPVRPLFLLRDGFLPLAMYEAIGGSGAAISISRFTARRAALADADAVRSYLEEEPTRRIGVIANQLGLSQNEAHKIAATEPAFRDNVLAPDTVRRIAARSAGFARRLAAHVAREGRVATGDVVMLVDLGYRGTVQDLAARAIEQQLGVTVAGRYLLLTDAGPRAAAKRGLFDARTCDHRLLSALARQIAIVEQVATSDAGSVIDYADNGRSIHKPNRVGKAQAATRAAIQAGAIAFARTAPAAVHRAPAADDGAARRRMALAILGRLLFLPQADEIAIVETFEHDVNLGTDDLVGMVDRGGAGAGLRRRGLPYLRGVDRMFLPGELQPHGLPLSLSLFAANRFELDLRAGDFAVASLSVPVLLADAARQMSAPFDAPATHDGFHAVTIPIGAARLGAGIQLGLIAEIVQIEEIAFYRVADFARDRGEAPQPIAAQPVFDAMERIAEGLWRCGDASLLFVPPPTIAGDAPLLLSVVFRPVVAREGVALRAAA